VSISRVHHLGLTVRNAEASAEWYSTVLGFFRAGDYVSPDGARRKVFLRHDRLDVRLGLCQHSRSDDSTFDETRPGLDHLAFAVDSLDELMEWEQRLRAGGVAYTPASPANTIEGARVLVFRDPDDIQLELVAAQARPLGGQITRRAASGWRSKPAERRFES
jgi:glyoxylase I family protein